MRTYSALIALSASGLLAYLSYASLYDSYGLYSPEKLPLAIIGFVLSVLLVSVVIYWKSSNIIRHKELADLSIIEKWRMYTKSRFPERVKYGSLTMSAFLVLIALIFAGVSYYEANRYETKYPFRIDKYKGTMEELDFRK